jgi:hypothetical protein
MKELPHKILISVSPAMLWLSNTAGPSDL